nr:HAMP domain-containing sensor histidine kinase [Sphingobacterium bovistauri]
MKKILTIIAHDVRTPLSSIQNLLILYKEKIISREIAIDTFESINKRLVNLDETLIDLLNWSSTSLSRSEAVPKDIKLFEAINQLCIFHKSQLETKNLTIQTNISSDLTVFADPDHLNIIVRNILNNAVKFSFKDGLIMLSAKEQNDQIILTIKDFGLGISEQKIKSFFESVQTPSFGTAGERGAGLGLVLVNDLILQNNGHITVKSKLGEGSSFNISLPKSKEFQQMKVLINA